jgi:ubiquinone/menaquinone biosynthesis C-methylase UbiE
MTTLPADSAEYLFANAWDKARERMEAGNAFLDPWTTLELERLGVSDGWSCLEVGGGTGSIASWLCARVGSRGQVLATDLDTHFLEELQNPNLTVLHHDVVAEPLPTNQFDLVHARLVLSHLPERDAVLAKLVQAVKPGGWILVEDFDHITVGLADPSSTPQLVAALDRLGAAHREAAQRQTNLPGSARMDAIYGRRLYGAFRQAHLVNIAAEGRCVLTPAGGSAFGRFLALSADHGRKLHHAAGHTDEEVDQAIAALADPNLVLFSHMLVSASGQRPPAGNPS